jgi:DNA-binding response OmpR family regulator
VPIHSGNPRAQALANLLIVEDDSDVLDTLRTVLEEHNHVVKTASTNQRAHQYIREGGLDLIISDAILQGGNGENIVVSASSFGVPILMISGDGEKSDQFRRNSIPFLLKPFGPSALISMVDRLLGNDPSVT